MKTISLELIDDIVDTQNYNWELENESDIKFLNVLLNRLLSKREQQLIRLYYGIGVEERMSKSEMGRLFDWRPDKVHAVLMKAERKLKENIPSDLFN